MDNISFSIPTMLTIKEAAARTGLSYDMIRKMCLNNQIVYVKAGCKFLINFEKLIDFLNGVGGINENIGGDPE